jgi:hypothetical protein
MITKRTFIIISSIACFTGCIGDFYATFVLGDFYPGYSHLLDTMSKLGTTASPVSEIISLWWIILGFLTILFAVGFSRAFDYNKKYVKIATWLLIFYGLGEGLGSALFKAELVKNTLNIPAILHEVMGGIGIFAILFFPLAMIKIIPRPSAPGFYLLSILVIAVGVILIALFLLPLYYKTLDILAQNKGLWQRLFVLDYYLYLMVIAIKMIKNQRIEHKLNL